MTGMAYHMNWFSRLIHWLFGAPFTRLPAIYGNSVPIDLQTFQARAVEAQHTPRPTGRAFRMRHQHSHPARQDESLERE